MFSIAQPYSFPLGQLFDGLGLTTGKPAFIPAADIEQDENGCKIFMDLPGQTKSDVKINIENKILTVSGDRKNSSKADIRQGDRSHGVFSRSFSLPDTLDTKKISAKLTDGVLEIYLPKLEETKPKTIEITIL